VVVEREVTHLSIGRYVVEGTQRSDELDLGCQIRTALRYSIERRLLNERRRAPLNTPRNRDRLADTEKMGESKEVIAIQATRIPI